MSEDLPLQNSLLKLFHKLGEHLCWDLSLHQATSMYTLSLLLIFVERHSIVIPDLFFVRYSFGSYLIRLLPLSESNQLSLIGLSSPGKVAAITLLFGCSGSIWLVDC